jgi:hypothetical protein
MKDWKDYNHKKFKSKYEFWVYFFKELEELLENLNEEY